MTRPVNYDSTMLLRLSSEMKEAFYAACKARGVVPSEHARQLITDYVLNHWGIDKPKSTRYYRARALRYHFGYVPS